MNNELYHYGVKGMKWGVRRYQNADGSLTSAGKKKLATSIKKQYPRDATNAGRQRLRRDIADDLSSNYKRQLRARIDDIKTKKKLYDAASEVESAYYDSSDHKKNQARAYNETLKWFEKNDPEYLRTIIKNNNGDKNTLRRFHDFDKVCDGYTDRADTEGLQQFYKKNGLEPNAARNASVAYHKSCENAAREVVGIYGNTKVPKQYSYQRDTTVGEIIKYAIMDMVEERFD